MSAERLLRLLADGNVHSGERLAARLNVTRAAVWNFVSRLRAQGIEVHALARTGYRLERPLELLDGASICSYINPLQRDRLSELQLHFELDSTNDRLLEADVPMAGMARACFAELQNRGRGRRGRAWISSIGTGIALSISWCFTDAPTHLSALSLAVGVAVLRAIKRAGAAGMSLKWPNDIWYQERKVGGVLVEMRAEAGGPAFVVIGVGLNVELSASRLRQIESSGVRAAAVADACAVRPTRNLLAGALIDELIEMLARFSVEGFAPFRDEWRQLDALVNRGVTTQLGEQTFCGIARGIDTDGGLILDVDGELKKFVSGEASLRLQTALP